MWQPCGAFRHRRAHTPAIGVRRGFTPLQAPKRAITRGAFARSPRAPTSAPVGPRLDLNQRPLRPERSALPDCATARGGPRVASPCAQVPRCRRGSAPIAILGSCERAPPRPPARRRSRRRVVRIRRRAARRPRRSSGHAPRSIRRSAAVAARPVRRADLSDRARGDRRRFVVERDGRILVVRGGRVLRRPFLDITSDVSSGGESGLLSMAFAPDYARSRRFYVYYTDNQGFIRVEQFSRARSTADRALPSSRGLVIRLPHSASTTRADRSRSAPTATSTPRSATGAGRAIRTARRSGSTPWRARSSGSSRAPAAATRSTGQLLQRSRRRTRRDLRLRPAQPLPLLLRPGEGPPDRG